ncbi:MAG: hypothetical protein WC635_12850 [Bacteriovorax sp.]
MKKSLANNRQVLISFFGLFTSFGTLICCALPALLISLGMGATLIGLVSNFPKLIWISENKPLVFALSFFLITLSVVVQHRSRNQRCPLEPELAKACTTGRKWSRRITIFSVIVWIIGASFAFVPELL